ncbi:MAG: hypothetical protein ACYSUV_18725 [Planctomycetota bacterium]|jgi:hypothetical protein
MATFKASSHWPYYRGETVYFDADARRHFTLDQDGQHKPTCNPIAADYAAKYNPDGSRKDAQK